MAVLDYCQDDTSRTCGRRATAAHWLIAAAVLFTGGPIQTAAAADGLEDAIKAAYIYKFAPFVTWPHEDAGPFTLCVQGSDAVAALLPQVTAGQQVDGRPIVVRVLSGGELPADCRILYVAHGAEPPDAAHGKPVLTVTNDDAMGHGIVQLLVIDRHVRFDIDLKLAADADLSISSKLLGLAHAVTPAKREHD